MLQEFREDTNKPSENKISLKPFSSNKFLIWGCLSLKYFALTLSTWQQLPISYLIKLSGDYVNIKYILCLLGTQDMIFKIIYYLHFQWEKKNTKYTM